MRNAVPQDHRFNNAHAVDAPISARLHVVRYGRRATDVRRSPIAVTGGMGTREGLHYWKAAEDQKTAALKKAGAIADAMHVRERVTVRGVYAASPSGNPPAASVLRRANVEAA
jgi:hypothetical protein